MSEPLWNSCPNKYGDIYELIAKNSSPFSINAQVMRIVKPTVAADADLLSQRATYELGMPIELRDREGDVIAVLRKKDGCPHVEVLA